MNNGWATHALGDIADVSWGDTKTTKSSYVTAGYQAFSASGPDGILDHYDYEQDGVVVSAIGAQCGKTWFASNKWSCIKNTIRILARDGVADARFLFYVTCGSATFVSRGSAQPFIAQADARATRVLLPSLEEQRRIAGVLGALDDLIEEENLCAERLDRLSRLLGAQYLQSLEGSLCAPLTELAEISKGYSYKSAELVPSDTLLVNLKNVGRGGEFQARGFKPPTASPKPHQYVENGDVVVAQTDLTQDRAVVGRPVRIRRGLTSERLVASLDLVIVRANESITPEYLFALLDSDLFRAHALAHCNGTTVVHMAAAAVPTFRVPIPDSVTLASFTRRVRALRDAADDAVASAQRLARARDELLPLLLSGRVSVSEVAA